MKNFYLFLLILVLFLFQYSALGVFLKSEQIPNLFVALTVSLAVILGFEKSLGWVILSGFWLDAGSFWIIGSGSLALVIILWLIDKIKAIAEFRSKKHWFAILLFLTAGLSSILFDGLLEIIFKTEKIFFADINPVHLFSSSGTDYVLKTIGTALSVILLYFWVRQILKKPKMPLLRNTKELRNTN